MTRRRFFKLAAAASGLGLGTAALYTWKCEPHWPEVVNIRLPIARLPAELKGSRLVQLSDLHIGPRVDDDYLLNAFAMVKELAPEIVAYTGDFISHEPEILPHFARVSQHLPHGSLVTIGILGNHDYGLGWHDDETADEIAGLAQAAGLRILRNEIEEVRGLQIGGLDDLWSGRFSPVTVMSRLRVGGPSLVLSHNPDTADLPAWDNYAGWILCGHTHGGQCKPPFLPAPLLPVKNRRYTAGVFELTGGRHMYINRGLGHLLQVRFNARPEITVFHLETA